MEIVNWSPGLADTATEHNSALWRVRKAA